MEFSAKIQEYLSAITIAYCCITYWLGGQTIPLFNRGFKSIRRFLLPIGLGFGLYYLHVDLKAVLISCFGLCCALHVGYQNKLWKYSATGFLMALPSLLIAPTPIFFLPMASHSFYGLISLRFNYFGWSTVALFQGLSIGACYVSAALARG